jgi:hypothetical protein
MPADKSTRSIGGDASNWREVIAAVLRKLEE